MKPIPQRAVKAAEILVSEMLAYSIRQYGKDKIPVADPSWAEAFGVLRGVLIARQFKSSAYQEFRLAEGNGQPDHFSVQEWMKEILDRIPTK